MKAGVSTFLDLSRWVAAFLVVINHARALVLADFGALAQHGSADRAFYLVTGLGHEAVVIFFVISGFLVGGVTLDRWLMRGPDLRAYACARTSRIYTTLVPALVIGIGLDFTGLHWFDATRIYTTLPTPAIASIAAPFVTGMNVTAFFGNLFMLQGVLTPTLGSNGPLWSLSYEWWYYCLFALAIVALTSERAWRIGWAAAALALVVALPLALTLWGFVWMLGIVAHRWVYSKAWRPAPAFGVALFAAALLASRLTHGIAAIDTSLAGSFTRDFVLGMAYMVALASTSRLSHALPLAALHRRLADFSYSTYLFHFPALLLLCAFACQTFGLRFSQQPDARGLVCFGVAVTLVYAYCFAASLLTERHTARVRHWLDAHLRAQEQRQRSVEPTGAPAPKT
ncbi:acyltransferase family protein [Paraburkholderia dinghuensis]|uniref:Acyltransferase n=1 Tax=Paraburkholderia dinghuensis TaxID=2305225 RepID=A0A3N6ME84_9BURK|nr:acyltransferase [Paraburkholderia dinghuensis]RQH02189.1 acyltransferase [Paraburkholderia dinghuensis]